MRIVFAVSGQRTEPRRSPASYHGDMPFSDELYHRALPATNVPAELPMVVLLTGFTDAGGVVKNLIELRHSLDTGTLLGSFDNDALLDYRARRPIVTFQNDHLTDYRPPRLEVTLERDTLGQPFLLLSGYEPDFAWESFVAAVMEIADDYEVASVTWVHSIGMPVPHTRTLGVTVSGNRSDLIAEYSVWQPHTQVPATAAHLMEYRFVEAGVPIVGFVLLVPHYLAEADYPGAMTVALDMITAATGLVFATDDITRDHLEFLERVTEQVQDNDDLQRMISSLEQRYDAYKAGRGAESGTSSLLGGVPLPSADELAAELERYLASRPGEEDK